MGSSESKMVACAPLKPEPAFKNTHMGHLMDPRSPSTGIDRTPIQVGVSKEVKAECLLALPDPRSPTVGISRTPVREVVRSTVGSLARRLGMLFHNEIEGKVPEDPRKNVSDDVEEEELNVEELASTEPLLTQEPVRTFGSLAENRNLLTSPIVPTVISAGELSPFVLLPEPQIEVELETETDITLEEAEEAKESPLHKRLSMSLITCHEGATSSQIFAEVHRDSSSSPVPAAEVEQLHGDGVDHSYALPSVTVEADSSVEASSPTNSGDLPGSVSTVQSDEEEEEEQVEQKPSSVETKDSSLPVTPVPSSEQPQPCTGIRCPTFDPRSPSQVVFKPQWLGKGFGAAGPRARGVQGKGGKGGSSPLAVHVAVKKVANENKGQSGKRKQKGTEGRSPLQILKETNSPRAQHSQVKLKVSTPDRQRGRVLTVSLDKENR